MFNYVFIFLYSDFKLTLEWLNLVGLFRNYESICEDVKNTDDA